MVGPVLSCLRQPFHSPWGWCQNLISGFLWPVPWGSGLTHCSFHHPGSSFLALMETNSFFLAAHGTQVAWHGGSRTHNSCNYLGSAFLDHSPYFHLLLLPQPFHPNAHLQAHCLFSLGLVTRSPLIWSILRKTEFKAQSSIWAWGQYTTVQLWSWALIETYLKRSKNKCTFLTMLLWPT